MRTQNGSLFGPSFASGEKSDKNTPIFLLFLMDENKLYKYLEASIFRFQKPLCCVKLDSLYSLYFINV